MNSLVCGFNGSLFAASKELKKMESLVDSLLDRQKKEIAKVELLAVAMQLNGGMNCLGIAADKEEFGEEFGEELNAKDRKILAIYRELVDLVDGSECFDLCLSVARKIVKGFDY